MPHRGNVKNLIKISKILLTSLYDFRIIKLEMEEFSYV